MENNNRIVEGDMVAVNFNGSRYTLSKEAKVLHTPCATGDSWIFEDRISKAIHYVSEGCTITKFKHSETATPI